MATVRLLPVGALQCASQSWRAGGKPSATIIAKATFVPGAGGALALATDPDPVALRDEHFERSPTRSVEEASDLAPPLPRGEVLLRGVAHATGGSRSVVRLVVARAGTASMDRRVVVRGDDARPGEPLLVPLTYENAIGGAGHALNPVGRGAPLLVDPIEPATPGSFGPIARAWRARTSLLGADQRRGLSGPTWTLDGVPPEYFHAAPLRQRIEGFFTCDEEIWIDGVSANGARIHWRLPGLRAEARVLLADAAHTPIELRADTLKIDATKRRVHMVWRGSVALGGDDERIVVAVGIAPLGEPIAWPDVAPDEPADAAPRSAPAGMDQTGAFELKGLATPTLPFGGAAASSPAADARPAPAAQWVGAVPATTIPAHPAQLQTLDDPSARAALLAGIQGVAAPTTSPPSPAAPSPAAPSPAVPPSATPLSAPPRPAAPLSAPQQPAKPMVVELAPVSGAMDLGTLTLDSGLGSLLIYAVRERLAAPDRSRR